MSTMHCHVFAFIQINILPKLYLWLAIFASPFAFRFLLSFFENGSKVRYWFLKIQQKRKIAIAKKDKRNPILYLRDFTVDGTKEIEKEFDIHDMNKFRIGSDNVEIKYKKFNLERVFEKKFKSIGPFVAIGDKFRDESDQIGAVRTYYSNEEWQLGATNFLNKSRLVIMRLSGHLKEGLQWEFSQVVNNYLHKTLLYLDISSQDQYSLLKSSLTHFNIELPEYSKLKKSKYLFFDKNLKPHVRRNPFDTPVYQLSRWGKVSSNNYIKLLLFIVVIFHLWALYLNIIFLNAHLVSKDYRPDLFYMSVCQVIYFSIMLLFLVIRNKIGWILLYFLLIFFLPFNAFNTYYFIDSLNSINNVPALPALMLLFPFLFIVGLWYDRVADYLGVRTKRIKYLTFFVALISGLTYFYYIHN
jgi:hypothetical protein